MPHRAYGPRDPAVLDPDTLGHVRRTNFRLGDISRDGRALVDGKLRCTIVIMHSISAASWLGTFFIGHSFQSTGQGDAYAQRGDGDEGASRVLTRIVASDSSMIRNYASNKMRSSCRLASY